jgi:hypothetical protein
VPAPLDDDDAWDEVDWNKGSWPDGDGDDDDDDDDDDAIISRQIDKAKNEAPGIRYGGGKGKHGHGSKGSADDFASTTMVSLDTFQDRLRFGLADRPHQIFRAASSERPDEHNYRWISVWDSGLDEDDWMLQEQGYETTNRQHSYWHYDAGERWDNFAALFSRPGLYGASPLLDPSFKYNVLGVDTCPLVTDRRDILPANPFVGCADSYDGGIRNSHALRLVA